MEEDENRRKRIKENQQKAKDQLQKLKAARVKKIVRL